MHSATDELARINDEVWRPFRRAYRELDLDAFAAIHTPDLVRVEVGACWIGTLEQYRTRTRAGFETAAERQDRLAIDFRFHHRLVGDRVAFERGIYRLVITGPSETDQTFFGRFSTVHRLTDHGWRIALDADDAGADASDSIGLSDFEHAHALDDLDPFSLGG